ncbi:uncharacterized protein [Euwallacea fornicatus]|uniref:uncharacterized protein n=1 Tax=Euwallacea fornicatus TaxID=995702 RepID=UPI00338EAEB7
MTTSSLIAVALNSELTRIPSLLQNILGHHFNNSLCNGVTWSLLFWLLFYACYSKGLNLFLKDWGFPEYLRIRLSNTLWMLSFYTLFLSFFITLHSESFFKFLFDFESLKSSIVFRYETIPEHKIVAYAFLCSFHIFSCYNQSMYWRSLSVFYKYLALFAVCVFAYSSRLLEVPFSLTTVVALSEVFEELCRLYYLLCNRQRKLAKILLNSLFVSSLIAFCILHFLVVPLSFPLSVGAKLFSQEPNNALLALLFVAIIVWMYLVIYQSPFLKLSLHWLNHREILEVKDEDSDEETELKDIWNKGGCLGSSFECSLFPPRGDVAFTLGRMRSEVKVRQKQMIARRKPKNKNMIIQTLKCMMVIKRKLSQKKECMNTQDELLLDKEFEDDKEQSQEIIKCKEAASNGSSVSAQPEGVLDENVADVKTVNLDGKLSSKFSHDVIDNTFSAANQEGGREDEEDPEDKRSTSEIEKEFGIFVDKRSTTESCGKIQ